MARLATGFATPPARCSATSRPTHKVPTYKLPTHNVPAHKILTHDKRIGMKRIELRAHPVAFREFGHADRASVPWLLIHGGGHDHEVWNEVAGALGDAGVHGFAPDLPAHGDSGGAALVDIDAMAAWVLELATALGLAHFRLCGHSMGALVALAAAAAAPTAVPGLVLIGCSVPMPVSDFLLDAARTDPPRAFELINKFSFASAETIGADRRRMLEERNLARMRRQVAGVLASDLAACNDWQAGLERAREVRCDSLLLCGEFDRMTPAASAPPLLQALDGKGRSARIELLAGSGHTMMEEAPQQVIEVLRN